MHTLTRSNRLITKKMRQYLLPGILSTAAVQLGNLLDSCMVSGMVGPDALSAIWLCTPVLFLMQLPALIAASGSAARIAVYLGGRQIEKGSDVFSAALWGSAAISLIFAALTPLLLHPVAKLLAGGSVEIEPHIVDYMLPYMLGTAVLAAALVTGTVVSVDNHPKLGASMFVAANVVNLTFDYIFLKYTSWKMLGAALSTIIGYGAGLLLVYGYIRSNRRMLKLTFVKLRQAGSLAKEIFLAGIPEGVMNALTNINFLILNAFVARTFTTDQLNIYSLCMSAAMLVELFMGGFTELIRTIVGVLFGEKDYYGVRSLMKRITLLTVGVSLLVTAIFMLFPGLVAAVFGVGQVSWRAELFHELRIYSLSFVFFSLNRIILRYTQTIGLYASGLFNTVIRAFAVLVPATFILGDLVGFDGVFHAIILAEISAILLSQVFRAAGQRMGRIPEKGYLMIPEASPDVLMDFTIPAREEEAISLSHKAAEELANAGIPSATAKLVGLAIEEMTVNICRYGKLRKDKKDSEIDLLLQKSATGIIIRIRDNGMAFDPTAYQGDPERDEFTFSGIEVVRKIASEVEYSKELNMNNTIIEIPDSREATALS